MHPSPALTRAGRGRILNKRSVSVAVASLRARICCLDLDTFFVSVERLLDPSLEGKAVIVGGRPGQRGVVTAASYEVRALGVKSGMSLTEAARLAPDAVYLPTRHGVYGDYAERVRRIAERFCPVIQIASIDEMYMDFAGCEELYRRERSEPDDAVVDRVVREMTTAVQSDVGLPSSAGVASSKQVAKIASGLAKPRGVLFVPAGREAELLAPLAVRRFPGIGPVAERKLAALGIVTLGELATISERELARVFGARSAYVRDGARGAGTTDLSRDRPAFREHDPLGGAVGSISNERTFREDVSDPHAVESMLCALADRVCWRARRRGVKARTVTLKLRYADFHTINRSRTMTPTSSELELFPVLRDVYRRARTRALPIRLVGVALSNLGVFDEQLSLFPGTGTLHDAVDTLRERFGYEVIGISAGRGTGRRGSGGASV